MIFLSIKMIGYSHCQGGNKIVIFTEIRKTTATNTRKIKNFKKNKKKLAQFKY